MHIHANPINLNQASLYSAAAAEEAASAQRAANVRNKLRSPLIGEAKLDPAESFIVGQWSREGSRQRQGGATPQSHQAFLAKAEVNAEDSISVWG